MRRTASLSLSLCGTPSCCSISTGVVGLRGLVEHEQPWYGPVMADEITVQGQVGDEVCADPVLGAADAPQRRGALGGLGHYREPVEVQAYCLAVLKCELLGPACHVRAQGD